MGPFHHAFASGTPKILAHRGDSFHAPENTMAAAEHAHEAGAFAWELDVHLTRDGIPIVIHDDTLDRTTNAASHFAGDPRGTRVSAYDSNEIRRLDAGSWFVEPQGGYRSARHFGTLDTIPDDRRREFASGAIRVPSLAEALAFTKSRGWLVNVELKSFPESNARLVDAVLDVVEELGAADHVLISSFDHRDLAMVATRSSHIATAALSHTPLHHAGRYLRESLDVDFHHVSQEAMGAQSVEYARNPGAASLAKLTADDLPTLVYTVNDAKLAAHLAELGVVGFFTDDPRGMRRIFGENAR